MKNLTIVCKDFELTSAIKLYIEEKMSSLYKYLGTEEDETSFNFRLGKTSNHHNNGKIYYSEVSIHTPEKNHGGRVEADDIYVAIDLLKDELSNNIKHSRDRSRTIDRKKEMEFKEQMHRI